MLADRDAGQADPLLLPGSPAVRGGEDDAAFELGRWAVYVKDVAYCPAVRRAGQGDAAQTQGVCVSGLARSAEDRIVQFEAADPPSAEDIRIF